MNYLIQPPKTRTQTLSNLEALTWYQNTSPDIKNIIYHLPTEFDGFLADLATKTDEIDNLEILRLKDLKVGNHLVIPIFEVRQENTNQVFTYEYVSWKQGVNPGYKGILLVENQGKITHFITKQTHKFSQNQVVYDSFGGFISYSQDTLQNFPKNQELEILRQLGLNKLKIKQFFDLGPLTPDIGLSNHYTSLFAAIIDGSESLHLNSLTKQRLATKGLSFSITLHPIEKLPNLIPQIHDSYFLASILRLATKYPHLNIPLTAPF